MVLLIFAHAWLAPSSSPPPGEGVSVSAGRQRRTRDPCQARSPLVAVAQRGCQCVSWGHEQGDEEAGQGEKGLINKAESFIFFDMDAFLITAAGPGSPSDQDW